MATRIIVKVCAVDEDGNELSSTEISNKEVLPPTGNHDFGYNQQEQLDILKKTQDVL